MITEPKTSVLSPQSRFALLFCDVVFVAVAGTLLQLVIYAQNPTSEVPKKDPRSIRAEQERLKKAAVEDLILSAQAQPLEISADLLLSLLAFDSVLEKKRQAELLESIFRRASEAKEPVKMVRRVGEADTRAGYLSMAHSLELDSLSIRLRTLVLMVKIDRQRARELFQEISPLRIKPLSCADDLEYDVALYYALVKKIANDTFDAEAVARKGPMHFVAARLEEIASPAQLGPALDLVGSYRAKPVEFRFLIDRLSDAFTRINSDPRSFANALKHDRLTEKVKFSIGSSDDGPSNEFLKAYRRYLAKNLSGVQCSDSVITITKDKTDPSISFANSMFERPLTEQDVKPEKLDTGAETFAYWRSPKAASILRGLKRLRFGDGSVELTSSQRSEQKWREQLEKFREEFNAWRSDDEETEIDYLHQKSVTFNSLFQVVPPGAGQLDVLREFGLFLRNSSLQRDAPLHWLFHAKYLLRSIKTFDADQREKFIDALDSTGNSAFSVYLKLDSLKQAEKGDPVSSKPTF